MPVPGYREAFRADGADARARPALGPGDLMFTGYDALPPYPMVELLTMNSVPSGLVIYLTDNVLQEDGNFTTNRFTVNMTVYAATRRGLVAAFANAERD